jgi:Zn-finger nucleic acid-binding protein
MADRQGVEIDYCPQCRGVWLERGELDKIIDRALAMTPSTSQVPAPPIASEPIRESPRHDPNRIESSREEYRRDQPPQVVPRPRWDDDDDDWYRRHPGKRRRGWLGDLFDFD